MKFAFFILFNLFSIMTFSQKKQSNYDALRWEVSVGSGPYLDRFWAIVGDPPGYPSKPGKYNNIGKIDRVEIKYVFNNNRSAISAYFQNSQWKELYGTSLDPLEVWTDIKPLYRRMHFTLNYYRLFPSGKRGMWSFGSGFQVQIEKTSFPFYRVDDPANPTVVTEISAKPDWTYFEDWAIPLTVAYHWTVNKNLKLGLLLNTAYTTGTGVDGLSLMGNIAIPFGKEVKSKKKK